MNYTLIRSNRRTIHMKLTPDGEIIVRAPIRCPSKYIEAFIESHEDWIERNRKMLLNRKNERLRFRICDGDQVSFCGDVFRVSVIPNACTSICGKRLMIPTGQIDLIREDLLQLIREYGQSVLKNRLDYWADIMGITYQKLKLSNARHRWGSCSRDGVIRISVFLLLAPLDAIDYVLVHELAHRRYFDHSASFWMLVASVIPDWKEKRKLLKEYQVEPLIQSLAVKEG